MGSRKPRSSKSKEPLRKGFAKTSKKAGVLTISLMMITAGLVAFLGLVTFAPAPTGVGPVEQPSGEQVSAAPVELAEERTLTSRTFRNPDGTYTLEAHIGQIHYMDEQGEFEPIDTQLIPTDYGWEMRKASYELELPRSADGWFRFINSARADPNALAKEQKNSRINAPPEWIDLKPLGVQPVEGILVGDGNWAEKTLRYENAYGPGVDLEFIATNGDFRKEVVIREKPDYLSQDLEFSFELKFSDDFEVRILKSGKEEVWSGEELVLDNPGKVILGGLRETWFRGFRLWDARGNQGLLRVRIENVEGRIILTKILDKRFLENAVYPVRTDATTSYYSGAGDGYMGREGDTNWPTCHDSANGNYGYYGDTVMQLGTFYISGTYRIYKAFFPINTSSLNGVNISSANFYFYVYDIGLDGNAGTRDFALVQTFQASTSSLEYADYSKCGDAITHPTEGAERIVITSTGYKNFSLNSTGLGWISKTGWTKLGVRTGWLDCDNVAPVDGSQEIVIQWRHSEYAGTDYDPYLEVTYTVSAPTVSTQAASSITETTATLNGNITATGGENPDIRGFEWGTSSGSYTDNWTETGSFGTGAFSHGVSGLTEGQTYYYRAMAHNSAGWGYGGEVSFTTANVAPPAPTGLSASPSSWTKVDNFTLNWTNPDDPSGISGAYYKLDNVPASATDGTYVADVNIQTITNITVGGDGAHPVYVWLKDGAGNADHNNRSSTTLYLDQTPPAAPSLVSPENNATVYVATQTLKWNPASDATSGVDNYVLYVDGSENQVIADNTVTQADVTFSAGSHTWYVKAVDYAGNENSSGTFNLTYTPNTAPEVLACSAPIADVNTEYDVKVEVRDNDNLSNVNEVWLVLYSTNVAQDAADSTRNHYTFKWVRGVGFSEVGPGGSLVSGTTPASESVTTDNYTFKVKLGKVAENTTWNVWAKAVDAASAQDNKTFASAFTVNKYIELSLNTPSLSFVGDPGQTVAASQNPTTATVTSNHDFSVTVRVLGDWQGPPPSTIPASNTKADEDGVSPYNLNLSATGQTLYTNVGWGSGVTRNVYWFLTIPSVPPGTYSNTLYVKVA